MYLAYIFLAASCFAHPSQNALYLKKPKQSQSKPKYYPLKTCKRQTSHTYIHIYIEKERDFVVRTERSGA